MQNIVLRAISGLVYVVLILGATFSGSYGQLFLAAFLGASAIIEFLQFRKEKHLSLPAALTIGILFLCIYAYANIFSLEQSHENLIQFLIVLLFFILLITQIFTVHSEVPAKVFHVIFGLIYIGFPLFLLPQLPNVYNTNQPWLLASIFILIWSSDTFAYLVGKYFGKRKLFERISPNKTWEGFIGGAFFTLGTGLILFYHIGILSIYGWLGLSVIVIIFGTIGDLFESALKRSFNLKDSGRFLPGHGGILDRIDSLLFALPIAYFYLQILETY